MKETELKVIQSTETFRRSRKLSNWDQSGQKWQSEHSTDSPAKVTPKSNEMQAKPQVLQAIEPQIEKTDLRGKEPNSISFKRQVQQDTFNGTASVAKKAKPLETVRTAVTAAFALGCIAVGVFTKSKLF